MEWEEIDSIDSFIEELEILKDEILELEPEKFSEYEEDDEGEDEEEYSDSFEKGMKEYQEKFKEYSKTINKEIKSFYAEQKQDLKISEDYAQKEKTSERTKTPWERGHRLGCGCPGCTNYREKNGITIENARNFDVKFPDLRLTAKKETKKEEYKENGERPCGGKHYHFFHGKNAEFKTLFSSYDRKLNLNLAGY